MVSTETYYGVMEDVESHLHRVLCAQRGRRTGGRESANTHTHTHTRVFVYVYTHTYIIHAYMYTYIHNAGTLGPSMASLTTNPGLHSNTH